MLPVPPPLPPQSWSPLTESLSQGPVFALPFFVLWLWPCGSVVVHFCAYTPAVLEPPRGTPSSPLPALQRVLVLSRSLLIHGSPLSVPYIPIPARLCQWDMCWRWTLRNGPRVTLISQYSQFRAELTHWAGAFHAGRGRGCPCRRCPALSPPAEGGIRPLSPLGTKAAPAAAQRPQIGRAHV